MNCFASVLLVGILTSPTPDQGGEPVRLQEPPEELKSPEELYETLKGSWRAADGKSPLAGFWLHRNEKAPTPAADAPPWGVVLDFGGGKTKGYRGAPEKVEADGESLEITLPPAGGGEQRETRAPRIRRDGDKLKVRVIGGACAGTYVLKRVPSKQ